MKRILVLTDFSDTAKNAQQVGMTLAKKANCELHIYHTIVTPIDWVKLSLDKERLYPEINERIAKAKSEFSFLKVQCTGLKLNYKTHLSFDRGGENLPQFVIKNNCDLVIIGSHGQNGIKKLMGSNTEHVISHTQRPVLIIKHGSKKSQFKELIIGSDSKDEIIKLIRVVKDLTFFENCQIYFLTPNDLSSQIKDLIDVELSSQKTNLVSVDEGNIITYIQHLAARLKNPVVVNNHVGSSNFPINIFSENFGMTLHNLPDLSVLNVKI